MVTNTTVSNIDSEFLKTQKGGTALLSGELERDFEGWEFWRCCQLEAVRGEHNHTPKEKIIQATGAEGSTDQRENVSRTSINMAYYCTP